MCSVPDHGTDHLMKMNNRQRVKKGRDPTKMWLSGTSNKVSFKNEATYFHPNWIDLAD